MTEQKTDDTHLNVYLTGKSALSDRYQQLPADRPSAHLDNAILTAAKREIHAKQHRLRWILPAAIAAMLIIGVSVLWWQQFKTPVPIDNKESGAPPQESVLPQQIDRSLHNNPAADRWLVQILKLHTDGKTAQAAEEFKKFRQAYPAYTVDQQRFGALQQYDE
jgi:hypothetical protein